MRELIAEVSTSVDTRKKCGSWAYVIRIGDKIIEKKVERVRGHFDDSLGSEQLLLTPLKLILTTYGDRLKAIHSNQIRENLDIQHLGTTQKFRDRVSEVSRLWETNPGIDIFKTKLLLSVKLARDTRLLTAFQVREQNRKRVALLEKERQRRANGKRKKKKVTVLKVRDENGQESVFKKVVAPSRVVKQNKPFQGKKYNGSSIPVITPITLSETEQQELLKKYPGRPRQVLSSSQTPRYDNSKALKILADIKRKYKLENPR